MVTKGRICGSVHMWIQNQAAFMDIQPMQCGLQADWMPVSLKIHTSPSGQSATLLSPKPEERANQSKQIFLIVRRAETQGSYKYLVVSVEITANESFRESFHLYDLSRKPSCLLFFFNTLDNHVESYWTINSKSILITCPFTHAPFLVLQFSEYHATSLKTVLTVSYLQTRYFTENDCMRDNMQNLLDSMSEHWYYQDIHPLWALLLSLFKWRIM